MKKIKVFYDVETTGFSHNKNSMHQLAGVVEVDDEVVEEFDYKLRPHEKAIITPEALKVCGVTEEELQAYPPAHKAHNQFKMMLGKYIDKYDRNDKAHLVGYNNRHFDDNFLRKLFELNNDDYFHSWFFPDSLDAYVLAAEYLLKRRPKMPNFKLATVAAELGISVEIDKTHDAYYDVYLTREVYRIVTGREFEI